MATKSFNEQITEIVNENSTWATKQTKLVKLGLTKSDIYRLGYMYGLTVTAVSGTKFAFTFGVELECYNLTTRAAENAFNNVGLPIYYAGYTHHDEQRRFKLVPDGSLAGNDTIECVTPVLKGTRNGIATLKKAVGAMNGAGARVNRTCGTHIHIGCTDMTDDWYVRIFRNYQRIEHIIDGFMPESRRGNNSQWCRSLVGKDFSYCRTIYDVNRVLSFNRYFKVNPQSWDRHHTIEFRQHSGTLDYNKIYNWLMFVSKLVEYSRENEITATYTNVNELPFLTEREKSFFATRTAELA
ncbi:MAG: amidoligase family protein [Muribaculaceae bacterium]|nr:amidoligase family protein [Muribaculaceae bacterium]